LAIAIIGSSLNATRLDTTYPSMSNTKTMDAVLAEIVDIMEDLAKVKASNPPAKKLRCKYSDCFTSYPL
jgi:hypothetical protein